MKKEESKRVGQLRGGWRIRQRLVVAAAVMGGLGVVGSRGDNAWAQGLSSTPMTATLDVVPSAPAGELMVMSAPEVVTWDVDDPGSVGGTASVVQLGRVGGGGIATIRIDGTVMQASAAVVWISASPQAVLDQQFVRVSLLGDAVIMQDGVTRSGPNLFVTALVRGSIRVQTGVRAARNEGDGQTYVLGDNLRRVAETPTERIGSAVVSRAAGEPPPKRELASQNLRPAPIKFELARAQTYVGADGMMSVILDGGAVIIQARPNGDFLELRAKRAVLITKARTLTELTEAQNGADAREMITAAYLEGDVRVTLTPGSPGGLGEQRLQAERVFYEFDTDRAILTDAVLHTVDPNRNLPVVMRAQAVRQIAQGEYDAERVELSTSSFAVPTYSVRASRMYIRQNVPTFEGDRARTTFQGNNLTLNTMGVPLFYLPRAGGDISNFPLRSIGAENSERFGFGVRTTWGLFESFGRPHPKDLDISFRVDYLSDRGPATGLDADYRGGLVTETTAEPWNFEGRLRSYFIYDRGTDTFGGQRTDVDPASETRGKILFEHQHFLPEDWQVQLRAGYSSDATFLEQYFKREFDTQLPYELSFYAKRQRDTEQLSLLAVTALNDFPTAADQVQEQTFVQRYPEIGYQRIGDSFLDDRLTLFSNNSISVLSFENSSVSLEDQGYGPGLSPGLPSIGQTGTPEKTVFRGDFRQEIDLPVQVGQFKVVPYIMARNTPYSSSPNDGSLLRTFVATGARVTTAFWQANDTISSRLFDVQRVRHVIEPGLNVFTSGVSTDRDEVYIYDEQVDAINDVSAAQVSLMQRWQTKRGGPGRWRSVDFVTLNVEGNFYSNQPDEDILNPTDFRGLYFSSLPETSIARNSVNSDATWRISDTTILLADQQYNLDDSQLATAAGGLAVQRDPRVSYFLEQRYVQALDSNITSVGVSYELSAKYRLDFNQSYDFSQDNNVNTSFTVNRRFDRLLASVTVFTDSINDETGIRFFLLPEGINPRGAASFFGAVQPQNNR